jgi:hypothetical protein
MRTSSCMTPAGGERAGTAAIRAEASRSESCASSVCDDCDAPAGDVEGPLANTPPQPPPPPSASSPPVRDVRSNSKPTQVSWQTMPPSTHPCAAIARLVTRSVDGPTCRAHPPPPPCRTSALHRRALGRGYCLPYIRCGRELCSHRAGHWCVTERRGPTGARCLRREMSKPPQTVSPPQFSPTKRYDSPSIYPIHSETALPLKSSSTTTTVLRSLRSSLMTHLYHVTAHATPVRRLERADATNGVDAIRVALGVVVLYQRAARCAAAVMRHRPDDLLPLGLLV